MTPSEDNAPEALSGDALATLRLRLRQSRRRAHHLAEGMKRLETVALRACASALAKGEVPGSELGELVRTTLIDLTDAAEAPFSAEIDAARAMIATFLGACGSHDELPVVTQRPQIEITHEIEDVEMALPPLARVPVVGPWMTLRCVEESAGRLVATACENFAYRLRDWAVREFVALDEHLAQRMAGPTQHPPMQVFSRRESDERAT